VHRELCAPAGIGPDPVEAPIGDELDIAVEIGAEYGDAGSGRECRQGLGRGVPVLVALPGGDDCHGRMRHVQQPGRGRGRRSVVPDLQHIHSGQHSTLNQRRLHRCLGVAGQQRREPAVPDDQDHRSVVDVAFRQGRRGIAFSRVQDVD
jgi:hypothetical protein